MSQSERFIKRDVFIAEPKSNPILEIKTIKTCHYSEDIDTQKQHNLFYVNDSYHFSDIFNELLQIQNVTTPKNFFRTTFLEHLTTIHITAISGIKLGILLVHYYAFYRVSHCSISLSSYNRISMSFNVCVYVCAFYHTDFNTWSTFLILN